ncbi:Cystathionine beta-lyase [Planctomycetes bacterium Poly30]|uniref:Cystathionine beta-lyase n=2 Tax=Saltatorellus ferox TaxID=2528018 RepID=A0A518EQR5_9BACT|nr:Cystathionine beta-lyase [Planctomycetes bacterium Poly30]
MSPRPTTTPPPAPRRTGTSERTAYVRAGRRPDPSTGAVVAPIHQTTTFAQAGLGGDLGFTYSRAGNPTVAALEEALGALEGAPPAVCHKTGMAAITALFLGVLQGGDRVAIARAVYGGTVRLAREILDPLGIEATFFDPTDAESVDAALAGAPRLVFIETPANPTLELVDVAAIAARAAGALLAVDNTFQTPLGLQPLELGADVSVYSTTKFIEGHDATLGGALVARDEALLTRLRRITKSVGSTQSPFEAWLTLRGLTTLPLRYEQHCESALVVAEALEAHPFTETVRHPGLASFPQRELAEQQHRFGRRIQLHGGIVTLQIRGGFDAAVRFLGSLRLVLVAENLGAPGTLATHPASMTHGDVPADQRKAAGIDEGLVRLSIGLEDPADLIADLCRALDASQRETPSRGSAKVSEEVAS